MKTVTVNVQIQLDIKGEDELGEVQDALDAVNEVLGQTKLNCEPQIFTSDISRSDIR